MIHTPEFQPYQPQRTCPWCALVGPNFCPMGDIPTYTPRRAA